MAHHYLRAAGSGNYVPQPRYRHDGGEFPRIPEEQPRRAVAVKCWKCQGSGSYLHYGPCFRCGGSGQERHDALGFPRDWSDEQCAAFAAKQDAAAAKRREKAAAKRGIEIGKIQAANVEKVPAVAALLNDAGILDRERVEAAGILRVSQIADSILHDIGRRIWSDKQVAIVAGAIERAAGFQARKAAELAAAVAVPAGRQEIEGEIISIKVYDDGRFGRVSKMLVKCAGFKVFGSVPAAIAEAAAPGVRVRFVAEIQPKEVGFGFFKRPSKAAIVN
jgi:hypothetical protein